MSQLFLHGSSPGRALMENPMVAFNVFRERLLREHDIELNLLWQADSPSGKVEHYAIIGQNKRQHMMVVLHSKTGYTAYFPQTSLRIDDDIAAVAAEPSAEAS
jgi:hypothetical protein